MLEVTITPFNVVSDDEAFFYSREESSSLSRTIHALGDIFMHGTCAPENASGKGET